MQQCVHPVPDLKRPRLLVEVELLRVGVEIGEHRDVLRVGRLLLDGDDLAEAGDAQEKQVGPEGAVLRGDAVHVEANTLRLNLGA
eukprot:7386521-Prymnesium_polylepis.1